MNQREDAAEEGQIEEPFFNTRDVTVIGLGRYGTNLVLSLGDDLTNRNDVEFNVCHSNEFKPQRSNNVMSYGWNVSRSIWDDHEFTYEEKLEEVQGLWEIIESLTCGTNVFILAAGAGGVFGSHGAVEISDFFSTSWAKIIAFMVMPFEGEGERRVNNAKVCIADLERFCDIVVVVSNPRLLETHPEESLGVAFARIESLFEQTVRKVLEARKTDEICFVLDDPDGLTSIYVNKNPRRDKNRENEKAMID
jgi:cell division GTPase FtsZ